MKKEKEKVKFKRIFLFNRWALPDYSRPGDWTIIGIRTWYSSPYSFCWNICVFGFECRFWFEKQYLSN